MLSPRSQEAQYNATMHYQPPTSYPALPATNGSQPAVSAPPPTQYPVGGGPIPSSFHSQNNYTSGINPPSSLGNSFSLPSANQGYYYEQPHEQPQQGQSATNYGKVNQQVITQTPTPLQQLQHLPQNIPGHQQVQQLPHYPTNSFSHSLSESDEKVGQRFFPHPSAAPYFHPGQPPQPPGMVNPQSEYSYPHVSQNGYGLSYLDQNQQQHHDFPIPSLIPHPSATTITNPSINHQAAPEEVPFPGVLEPQYRSNSNYQRSATFPNDQSINRKSVSTSSSTGSLLGMTPETARRNRCNICQKQFKRPSSLQTHLYSHTGEKPFICNWENCGRLFSVRSNMIRHRKLHERDTRLMKRESDSPKESLDSSITTKPTTVPKIEDIRHVDGASGTKVSTSNAPASGTGSLPNLLHPTNGNGHTEFQLGW